MNIRNWFGAFWGKFRKREHTCEACGCAAVEEIRLLNPETGSEYVYDLPRGYTGRRGRKEDFAETQRNFAFADALSSGFLRKMHGVVGGDAKEDVRKILDDVRDLEVAWSRVWAASFDAVHCYRTGGPSVQDSLRYLGMDPDRALDYGDIGRLMPLQAMRAPTKDE